DPRWLGREDVLFVASHAYAEVTGEDAVTFFDFAESLRETPPDEPADLGEDWDVMDVAQTRARLPRLSELFYERSMHNRRRALGRRGLPPCPRRLPLGRTGWRRTGDDRRCLCPANKAHGGHDALRARLPRPTTLEARARRDRPGPHPQLLHH